MPFSVISPGRSVLDQHARVLARHGLLKGYFSGNRRGTTGIPGELTYLNPAFGLWKMATRRMFSEYRAEWLRSAAHPLFDLAVRFDVAPGDHLISSYGYANHCFVKGRSGGGKTFLDAGNSHPENFWELITEEHRRWKVRRPPYPPHWNRQGRRTVELTDYVMSPSQYVSDSFLERGFTAEQILHQPYSVDLSVFEPRTDITIPASPLRVVCTGSVSLRKGFPYLLEAMRMIHKQIETVLVLTEVIETSMKEILDGFRDVPVEWTPPLPHDRLAGHLKKCHVFALLSLEEGMARSALEAMACGLPVVLTPNTGAADLVFAGAEGEVVPIRDPEAAAAAIIRCHQRQLDGGPRSGADLASRLSAGTFELTFLGHLKRLGMA